jgi:hypothetical protein
MEPFYLIVLGIATLVFILVLTGIGLMMRNQNQKTTFPPNANTCPDNWQIGSDGSCNIPYNLTDAGINNIGLLTTGTGQSGTGSIVGSLYTSTLLGTGNTNVNANKFNPNDPAWITGGKTQICAQQSWSSSNNIAWDGVSNYNSC